MGLFCSSGAALLFTWRDNMPIYVPALGAIALLGAWLVARVPPRAGLAALTSAAVVAALFTLGLWGFADLRDHAFLSPQHGGPPGRVALRPGVPHAIVGGGTPGNGAASLTM